MIYLPDEAKKLVIQDRAHKIVRIEWKNRDIPNISNAKIKQESLRFTESLNSSGNFKFGGAELCVLEFVAYDLPNVKDEIFDAWIDVELGADYTGSTSTNIIQKDGIYYATISLGTYKVSECKKELSMGGVNARRIEAYTDDSLNPQIIKQFDSLWLPAYKNIENMYVDSRSLLEFNDWNATSHGWETVNRGGTLSMPLSYYPRLGEYNSNRYYMRFSVSYHNDWVQALRNQICLIEPSRNFKKYNSNDVKSAVKTAINSLCNSAGISSYLGNSIGEVQAKLEDILDEAESYIEYNTPLYYFGMPFTGELYTGRNNRYHLMPWVDMEIELMRGSDIIGTQKVKFLEEEAFGVDCNLTLKRLYYSSSYNMPISMPLSLKKPEIGDYNDWMFNYRQSLYEISALFSKARQNFVAHRITTNGLVPKVGLRPKEGLYPSRGSWQPDKAYIESNQIKNIFVDESRVRFKGIKFEWNDFTGEQQTFTWDMPTAETADRYRYYQRKDIPFTKVLSSDKKQITITLSEEITSTIMFIKNLSLNKNESIDYLIADAYSDNEKMFTLMHSHITKSGVIDTNDSSLSSHNFANRSTYPYLLNGKLCNDKCVGVNKIIIRANNGAELTESMVSLNNVYEFLRDARAIASKVEFIKEGEYYELGTDNLIMNSGNFDGMEIMYLVDQLDAALRLIDYIPVDADIKGMPYMEAGDVAEFHSPIENAKTIVMRRTMQGIQSLMDNIESN